MNVWALADGIFFAHTAKKATETDTTSCSFVRWMMRHEKWQRVGMRSTRLVYCHWSSHRFLRVKEYLGSNGAILNDP